MEIHYNVQLDREKLATSFKNFNQLEKNLFKIMHLKSTSHRLWDVL